MWVTMTQRIFAVTVTGMGRRVRADWAGEQAGLGAGEDLGGSHAWQNPSPLPGLDLPWSLRKSIVTRLLWESK